MTSMRKIEEREKREKEREVLASKARCGEAWWNEKIDSVYMYIVKRALPAKVVISELRGLPRKVRSPVLAFEFLWREAGSRDDNIDSRT